MSEAWVGNVKAWHNLQIGDLIDSKHFGICIYLGVDDEGDYYVCDSHNEVRITTNWGSIAHKFEFLRKFDE